MDPDYWGKRERVFKSVKKTLGENSLEKSDKLGGGEFLHKREGGIRDEGFFAEQDGRAGPNVRGEIKRNFTLRKEPKGGKNAGAEITKEFGGRPPPGQSLQREAFLRYEQKSHFPEKFERGKKARPKKNAPCPRRGGTRWQVGFISPQGVTMEEKDLWKRGTWGAAKGKKIFWGKNYRKG